MSSMKVRLSGDVEEDVLDGISLRDNHATDVGDYIRDSILDNVAALDVWHLLGGFFEPLANTLANRIE